MGDDSHSRVDAEAYRKGDKPPPQILRRILKGNKGRDYQHGLTYLYDQRGQILREHVIDDAAFAQTESHRHKERKGDDGID